MKHTLPFLCAFLILQSPAYAGEVTGNGKVTIEKRTVIEWPEIQITGPFRIVVVYDPNDEFLQVETDQNLQEYVIAEKHDGITYINIKNGIDINSYTKMNLYIRYSDLHRLTLKSDNPEESDINMSNDACKNKNIHIEGSNPVSITMEESEAVLTINDSNTVKINGHLQKALIDKKGAGMLAAYGLYTNEIKLKNSGQGAVEFYANNSFTIHDESSGNIYYKGNGTVGDLMEKESGHSCREGYGDTIKADIPAEMPTPKEVKHHITDGIDVDSLFADMIERDQKPRRIKEGEVMHTKAADNENFSILKWFLDKYGYPEIGTDSIRAMFIALFMHIDDYGHFMQIRDHLFQAVKEGTLQANTYAYSCDRSMIASGHKPIYYYFMPGADTNDKYKLSDAEKKEVDKNREEIGLPPYPLFLHGRRF